ncbi:MAG: deoxynucleoside kinase [Bacteroidota bacterium]
MNINIPHNYIAIEGNIGAGKTTLCNMLAKDFNCNLVLEQFADNPFLPYFYENQERYAFSVELFFMTERHKQLQENLSQQNLFNDFIVADYYFIKTLLFARNNLPDEEFRLFQRLFHILNATFPRPDLLVYLHRSVEGLLQNIQKRGRSYEQDISEEYLLSIQNTYFDYFRTINNIPVLIIDVEEIDFLRSEEYYTMITESLSKTYQPGIHHLSFVK